MERYRQTVRDREPNKSKVHDVVLDGPLDGSSRATNHPLSAACVPKVLSTFINDKLLFVFTIDSSS
jgi:hypothetical protein